MIRTRRDGITLENRIRRLRPCCTLCVNYCVFLLNAQKQLRFIVVCDEENFADGETVILKLPGIDKSSETDWFFIFLFGHLGRHLKLIIESNVVNNIRKENYGWLEAANPLLRVFLCNARYLLLFSRTTSREITFAAPFRTPDVRFVVVTNNYSQKPLFNERDGSLEKIKGPFN